jgi:hypothetical protein
LLSIYQEVAAHGRVMQFWGDIINHYPELIPELPRDVIPLEWGYDAGHPFDAHAEQFAASGLAFYVCPGTSSWNSIGGRTANALANLAEAAQAGLTHGAAGYLITDWGDNGHWQPISVSDLGLAAGAAYAWAWDANRGLDVARAISLHAFGDPTGRMGQAAYELGNVYQAAGYQPHNSSALFWTFQRPLTDVADFAANQANGGVTPDTYERAYQAAAAAVAGLEHVASTRPTGPLLKREFQLVARMLRHAARRGQLALGAPVLDKAALRRDLGEIIDEYIALWHARSRPGGLEDSVDRLQKAGADYDRG